MNGVLVVDVVVVVVGVYLKLFVNLLGDDILFDIECGYYIVIVNLEVVLCILMIDVLGKFIVIFMEMGFCVVGMVEFVGFIVVFNWKCVYVFYMYV